MSSVSIATRVSEMSLDIQKIFKKISQLESLNENLSKKLNNEISQRQNLEKHTLTSNEEFSGQLNTLKGTFENFEIVINQNMEKLKIDISDDFKKKNTEFVQIIENNLKSNKFNPLSLSYNNISEETYTRIQKMIDNEFNQYRSELNTIKLKSEYHSKKLQDIVSQCSDDFNGIQKEIQELKNENEQLKIFRLQTIAEINKMKDNNLKKDNSYESFVKKMDDILLELNGKMRNYDDIFRSHTNNFELIKNDFFNQFKDMNNIIKNNNKEMNDNVENKINICNKEIENFENHILSENDKFVKYIQNHIDEQNSSLKRLFDYANEDIELLKGKIMNLDDSIKKLRTEVFKGINETEEFLEKKYDSIYRIVNKVN